MTYERDVASIGSKITLVEHILTLNRFNVNAPVLCRHLTVHAFSYFTSRFVIGDYMDIAVTPPIVEDRGYYGRGRGGYNRGGPRGGGGDRRFRPY